MEKTITRSFIFHEHAFALFNNDYTVSDVKKVLLEERLGARKEAAFKKANNLENYSIISVKTVVKKYTMPLSVFLEHATEIVEDSGEEKTEA